MGQLGPRYMAMVAGVLLFSWFAFKDFGVLFRGDQLIAITSIASFAVIAIAALVIGSRRGS